MLSGVSDEFIYNNEGEGTWSPYNIVGHLIHGEDTDWIPRAKIILEYGLAKSFEPYDRFAQEERFNEQPIAELLDLFEKRRRENLEILEALNLNEDQLKLKGMHPAFGEVTLQSLLCTWVVHDLSHINQISRVMARNYTEEVGPWKEYISIMQDRDRP